MTVRGGDICISSNEWFQHPMNKVTIEIESPAAVRFIADLISDKGIRVASEIRSGNHKDVSKAHTLLGFALALNEMADDMETELTKEEGNDE